MVYYYLLIFLTLTLLACKQNTEVELEEKPKIDWEKELFGVGVYGTHPDSLTDVWYSFTINKTSLGYIKSKIKPNSWFTINGDTVCIKNEIAYNKLKDIEDFQRKKKIIQDSSIFIASYGYDSLIQFTKHSGDPIIPNTFYIRPSKRKMNKNTQYLSIKMFVTSTNVNFSMTTYQDTTSAVISCFRCDDRFKQGKVYISPKDQEFINSFINTLISLRHDGKRTGAICTLGYSFDMELIYDSLSYKYDNLCVVPVKPDILHEYFSYVVDTSQFKNNLSDFDKFDYLYSKYFDRGYRFLEKGNNLVDTAVVEMIE